MNDLNTDLNPTLIKKYRQIVRVILTVLLLLIIWSIYWVFIKEKAEIAGPIPLRPTPEMNREPESPTAYAQVDSLNTLSTSDELSIIEADFESTNLDSLYFETTAIEAELNKK
ncbi:MAG: hypothetical protein KBC78_01685 [Candidatus Pacebacteria bacterium]|mgnify:FL=1|nr:hypothetical protein [Candidatus Paceibacterota bacterium]